MALHHPRHGSSQPWWSGSAGGMSQFGPTDIGGSYRWLVKTRGLEEPDDRDDLQYRYVCMLQKRWKPVQIIIINLWMYDMICTYTLYWINICTLYVFHNYRTIDRFIYPTHTTSRKPQRSGVHYTLPPPTVPHARFSPSELYIHIWRFAWPSRDWWLVWTAAGQRHYQDGNSDKREPSRPRGMLPCHWRLALYFLQICISYYSYYLTNWGHSNMLHMIKIIGLNSTWRGPAVTS
jgi:hypothetical protein